MANPEPADRPSTPDAGPEPGSDASPSHAWPTRDRTPEARSVEPGQVAFAHEPSRPPVGNRGWSAGPATDRFGYGERVHWHARFTRSPGSIRIDVVTVAREADGWERVVSGHERWLAHPSAPGYSGWLDPAAYGSAGRFVLRFVRGADVLAEGEFEVLPAPDAQVVH
jgi:hypothetical protein